MINLKHKEFYCSREKLNIYQMARC